jgi:segregation and condensation protein A
MWLLRRQLVTVDEVPVDTIAHQIGWQCDDPLQVADEVAVAAELAWMKSALLLPQPEAEALQVSDDEPTDGEPLRRRLLRHAAYGLAARFLAERHKVWSQMYPRSPEETTLTPLKELTVGDEPLALLTEALRRVVARLSGAQGRMPRRRLTVPQRLKMLLQQLRSLPDSTTTFDALCADCTSLLEVIVTFLAVLELVRRGIAGARQDEPFGPILVFLKNK